MRNFLITSFVMFSLTLSAQNKDVPVSVTSPMRDTLFLLNDGTGKAIAGVWGPPYSNSRMKIPVIIFISEEEMQRKYNQQEYDRRKQKGK